MSKKLDKIITNAIMLSIKITCCCPYVARCTMLHVMQSVFVLHAAAVVAAATAFQSNHSASHALAHSSRWH